MNLRILGLLLLLPSVLVARPFGDGFSTKNLEDYLDLAAPGETKLTFDSVEGMTGKAALNIAEKTEAKFKAVPVDPNTKYTLKYRGRFVGGESIEENPTLDISLFPRGGLSFLPSRSIDFLDAERKELAVLHQDQIDSGLPFRQWHDYVDVFYTPAQAAFMVLKVRSAPGVTFTLDSPTLEKTGDEKSLTINPSFDLGPFNYSGWSGMAAGAGLFQTKEGRAALDAQYGSYTDSFPVSEPGTYQVFLKATSNGYASIVSLSLFDKDGKLTAKSFSVRNKALFLLPPGTVSGRFLVRSMVLEELRLVHMGDESKLKELRN